MKKLRIFLFSLVLVFGLISCQQVPQTKVYNIEYYIDGEKVELLPNSYLEGQHLILPMPELEEGLEFNGWYDNEDLNGEKIIKLTNQASDLKLYAETLTNEVNAYNITYYVNGVKTNLEPSIIEENKSVNLPTPKLSENETFNGWYLNKELSGEKLSVLNNVSSDVNLYGQITKNEIILPDEDDLEKVFSYSSFTFELKYESTEYSDTETFYVDNYKYQQSGSYGNMYLEEVNNISYCYFEEDGKTYYMTEEDEDYNYFATYLFTLDLTSVDIDMFKKVNDYYTVDNEDLNEAGFIFTGYEETVKSFKMYVVDNKISKILLETEYEETDYSYIITFSNFGNTKVQIPEAEYYYENNQDQGITSILEVYNLSKGETVTIEGQITGIYGNNFYISDNEKGILVYMGNNSEFASLVELGSNISVTGTVDIYKTLHQISSVTSIFTVDKEYSPKEVYLSDVKQTTLQKYANDIVNIDGLEIKTIPLTSSSNSDISFQGSIDGVEVNIFVSKHLSKTIKDPLLNKVKTLGKGSFVSLNNVHISYYDKYQIVLTSSSEIYEDAGIVLSRGLELSKDSITVEYDTELNDILSNIEVYEKFSDGTKTKLDSSKYSVDIDGYEKGKSGTFDFVYSYDNYSVNCTIVVRGKPTETTKVEIEKSPFLDVIKNMGYDQESDTTYGVNLGLPSIGTPKVLVIPIAFSNVQAPANMVANLEKVFFGNSNDTGWESLKSYYYKSSYGLLDISGTILEPYNTGKTTSYYENLYAQYLKDLESYENYETDVYPDCVEYEIIKEVLEYYDNQIDYSDYDYNDDGYIDSIYLVYTADYEEDSDSFWWAYTNEYYTDDYEYYDNVEADFYMFMSYEFFFDQLNGETIKYNAETLIHETGHLLGLDDYYDYDSSNGPDGGIGGGDMMDYNVGDHNAYSKLLMGWIDPYVVSGATTTINLGSFSKTGDAVFIFKDYEESFFDEYYVIDFYTPDGLNEFCAGDRGLFSEAGIRIYHVDATLNKPEDCWSIYELTKFNNSYTDHLLIKLIEADGKNDIESGDYSENSDLFGEGESYTNIKWYDNSSAGFTIKVNYIENGTANITIEYK